MFPIFKKPEDVKPDYFYAKIDDRVIAWNDENEKICGHFAGIQNEKALVFAEGKTSWTTNEVCAYTHCIRSTV